LKEDFSDNIPPVLIILVILFALAFVFSGGLD